MKTNNWGGHSIKSSKITNFLHPHPLPQSFIHFSFLVNNPKQYSEQMFFSIFCVLVDYVVWKHVSMTQVLMRASTEYFFVSDFSACKQIRDA